MLFSIHYWNQASKLTINACRQKHFIQHFSRSAPPSINCHFLNPLCISSYLLYIPHNLLSDPISELLFSFAPTLSELSTNAGIFFCAFPVFFHIFLAFVLYLLSHLTNCAYHYFSFSAHKLLFFDLFFGRCVGLRPTS